MNNAILQQAARAAVECERKTGMPALLAVAQWAIESAWGKSAPSNNCFGIKVYPGCFDKQLLPTREWFTAAERDVFLARDPARTAEPTGKTLGSRAEYKVLDWFASFPSLLACFERRATIFDKGRYRQFAVAYAADHDFEKLVRGFAPIYATDPGYASLVMKIANQENVQKAIEEEAPSSAGVQS